MHHHDHSHHDHSHGKNAPFKTLMLAIVITFGYAIVELLGGWLSGSLALLGDAGHMGSDALALIIAAFAAWMASKPPSAKHSYGLGRAEVVAAWISSLFLFVISIAVIVEAVRRLHTPEHVHGGPVMLIAFIGLLVNLLVAWVLSRGEQNINIRAALLHVLSDVLGSLAALISGAVIYFTGWLPIDPIISIIIGVLILISSIRILRESLLILMEGVPKNINLDKVSDALTAVDGVNAIHDLHIWTLSSGNIALSAHVNITEFSRWSSILQAVSEMLNHQFHINHITLQPEPEVYDCNPCR